jgi:hypothetical protein
MALETGRRVHQPRIQPLYAVSKGNNMQAPWKRLGVAAVAALAIVGFAGSANAQHYHGGGGGYYGGGGAFIGGLAAGALIGASPYYGGYYGGPYGYYNGGPYAYAGGCYIQRQWVINRYGHRVWRRIQVCN